MTLHDLILSAGQAIVLGVIARVFFLLDRKLQISHDQLANDLSDVKQIVNGAATEQRIQIKTLTQQLVTSTGKEAKP